MSKLVIKDLDVIFSVETIRKQAQRIFDLTLDRKTHFNLHLNELESGANFVYETILSNYPDLNIPYHSRWGHFCVGELNRVDFLNSKLQGISITEKVKSKLDLVIVSVLLDAGAGNDWFYTDTDGRKYSRSEGLAVASFNMFVSGAFSSDKKNNLRVDADKLSNLTEKDLSSGFQVSSKNSLIGISNRLHLLKNLGKVIKESPMFVDKDCRPGNLINYFFDKSENNKISAPEILKSILFGIGNVWPSRLMVENKNLGDVWHYPNFSKTPVLDSLVPFHKLSQWLTYSMIEPIEEAGLHVTDVQQLTGLPEYRNGGFMIDQNILTLRNPADLEKVHTTDSPFVIEWRALTVVLLDKIAEIIRKKLNKSVEEFPLAKVLEGGTWRAGRKIASQKRSDGGSPLKIQSDGTVF